VDIPQPRPQAIQKLLHVNNPPQLLRLVEKFCQSRKIAVDSLESGSAAFHHALVKQYHLILVGAPSIGIDVPRLLMGLTRAKITTPVLIMTESRLLGKADFSKFPNCIGVLSKPLDLSELSKYLEFLNKPIEIKPQEKEKLMATLRKWEMRMSDAV
jgi:DNA-binding response OmpR family regulator